jgi:hypothetical protein
VVLPLVVLVGALVGGASDVSSQQYLHYDCVTAGQSYYDSVQWYWSTCSNGAHYATTHGSQPLAHRHRYWVSDPLTTTERADAQRYFEEDESLPDPYDWGDMTVLDDPTPTFNCFSYAFYDRGDYCLDDPSTALDYDFDAVLGTMYSPFQVGQVCCYWGSGSPTHASIIVTVQYAYGQGAANAASVVKGKWGSMGKYQGPDDACYGQPGNVYKPKS